MRAHVLLLTGLWAASSGCSLVLDPDALQGGDVGVDLGPSDTGVDLGPSDTGVDLGCGVPNTDTHCGACGVSCAAGTACQAAGSVTSCVPVDCGGERQKRLASGASLTDGLVRIDPDGRGAGSSFLVHCRGLGTAAPTEYLDVSPNDVWSRYGNDTDCTGSAKYMIRRFQRIRLRIDAGPPVTYATDPADYTFTNVEFQTVDGQPSSVDAFRACAGSPVDMDPALARLAVASTCGGGALTSVRFPETGFRVPPAVLGAYALYDGSVDGAPTLVVDLDGQGFGPESPLGRCATVGPASLAGVALPDQRIPLERVTGTTPAYASSCAAALPLASTPSPRPTGVLPTAALEVRVPGDDTAPAHAADCALPAAAAVRWVSIEVPPANLVDLAVSTPTPSARATLRVFDACGGTCVAAGGSSNAFTTTLSNPATTPRTLRVAIGAVGSTTVQLTSTVRP